ncbi:hypothetical protein SAMN05192569_10931, partial [Parageobacillus thermantarcticus]
KKDQFEMAEDLKLIYRSPNKKTALEMFQQFESKSIVIIVVVLMNLSRKLVFSSFAGAATRHGTPS